MRWAVYRKRQDRPAGTRYRQDMLEYLGEVEAEDNAGAVDAADHRWPGHWTNIWREKRAAVREP